MKDEIIRFIRHARLGYIVFTSFLILGFVFGGFEIVQEVLLKDVDPQTLRWLHFSRGMLVSFFLVIWATWTVYNYREIYQEQLAVTEGRYRNIIEHSADAILSFSNNGYITSWNRGAEQIMGWDRTEIMGKPVNVLVPQELVSRREPEYIENEMRARGYVKNYETERLTKQGNRVLVALTESFIRNEKGEVVGRSQILRDLTDLKLQEEQIQHSERLATLGHMAAGVAHEVGNPLASISSLVQVCQRKTDDPFIQEQLKKVRDHIRRITKIVRDLVDFSRPSGTHHEVMQLNKVISDSVGLLKHDARCRYVDFQLQLDPELPRVEGVPDHLHQVMVNLLMNAVDAMDEVDEPKVVVETKNMNSLNYVMIRDNGKGIKEEYMSRIFEPFFTTKEVGNGTGLGLSVSHGIITKMGGTISAKTELDKGTTFTITLPIQNNTA